MRFVAPPRGQIDLTVFERPPLSEWREFDGLLRSAAWPDVDALNALRRDSSMPHFITQTRELEDEGLHYESRIDAHGAIATRPANWHDLLNALIWIRYPRLKAALNRRQVAEIAVAGPKQRTRAQCALTHFDEAGVIVVLRDASLLPAWDAHDWTDLFWKRRDAWRSGDAVAIVFGHALLEHALRADQLLCGKTLVLVADTDPANAVDAIANRIADATLLRDPQELRPLPLSGIPGWLDVNENAMFYRTAACFSPLRVGRRYPQPVFI
ncbi:MAG TPA: DUF3025 domain-containing protein [Rudaea sp.]|jgi:hypothetical protein|nr:DUF3025 domain-containing protein [Rudaea sp.]